MSNDVELSATVVECAALRWTPAGVPALDLRLQHVSTVQQLGQARQVGCTLKAVALGPLAQTLAQQGVGSEGLFRGFLASTRQSDRITLQIQEFVASRTS